MEPLGYRCRICQQLRQEEDLDNIKKAGALARRPLSYSGDYDEATNIELIAYCRDDMACMRGAVKLAGDLIVR